MQCCLYVNCSYKLLLWFIIVDLCCGTYSILSHLLLKNSALDQELSTSVACLHSIAINCCHWAAVLCICTVYPLITFNVHHHCFVLCGFFFYICKYSILDQVLSSSAAFLHRIALNYFLRLIFVWCWLNYISSILNQAMSTSTAWAAQYSCVVSYCYYLLLCALGLILQHLYHTGTDTQLECYILPIVTTTQYVTVKRRIN